MNNLPVITIVTVVYNGADSLLNTINNVAELDYPNINYFIIDGGSNDGTLEIIRQNQKKIKYWVSEKDNGIYDAMNKGWIRADADSFILFLGSGDKILKLPDMSLYSCNDVIYGDVQLGEAGRFKSTVNWRFRFGNTVHHQSMLVRKSVHPDPPFSLAFKVYADFDFNQRLMKAGVGFHKDKDFYAYALGGGISAQINTQESLKVVKKNYGPLMSMLASLYYQLRKIYAIRKINSSNSSL